MKNANQNGRRAFSMISGANQTFSFGAGLIVIVESLMQLSKSQSLFAPYLIAYLFGIVSYIYIYIQILRNYSEKYQNGCTRRVMRRLVSLRF